MTNLIKRLKKIKEDKAEYKAYKGRIEKLPEEYRFVFEKLEKYFWNHASGDGYDMLDLLYNLLELFESSASDGISVGDVVGENPSGFADEILRLGAKTWEDKWRDKLNKEIGEKLK